MNRTSVIGVAFLGIALISAPTAAQKQPQAMPEEMKAMILEAVNAAEAQLFTPGPREADWSKGGTDLRAAVAVKPNGLQGNYLLTIDKDSEPSVTIYTSAPVASFVPASWKRVSRIGEMDSAGPGGFLEFATLEGPYYLVARGVERRVGDAFCSSAPTGADLYQAPGDDGQQVMPAEVAMLLFKSAIDMTAKYTVCERYEAKGTGYSARYFFEDGRALPGLNANEDRISIVPARPVAELLKPKG